MRSVLAGVLASRWYDGFFVIAPDDITAHALPEERERCLAAGMTDFLSEPFRGEELYRVVEGQDAPE